MEQVLLAITVQKTHKMKAKTKNGFTLIEILVSLTIISLLVGVGYAGFRDFSRSQALEAVTRELRGELRAAQSLASSGYKPSNPTHVCEYNPSTMVDNYLRGYNISAFSSSYVLFAICTGGTFAVKRVYLPTDYTIWRDYLPDDSITTQMDPQYFMLKALSQGTNLPTNASVRFTITNTKTGATSIVTVTSSGEII